jgi:hypothetical protein
VAKNYWNCPTCGAIHDCAPRGGLFLPIAASDSQGQPISADGLRPMTDAAILERAEAAEASHAALIREREEALKLADHNDLKWLALDYQKRGDLLAQQNERVKKYRREREALRTALEPLASAVKRMAERLGNEPGNQTVVALWLYLVKEAEAALSSSPASSDHDTRKTKSPTIMRDGADTANATDTATASSEREGL